MNWIIFSSVHSWELIYERCREKSGQWLIACGCNLIKINASFGKNEWAKASEAVLILKLIQQTITRITWNKVSDLSASILQNVGTLWTLTNVG